VACERLADALGAQRPAAEGDHPRVVAGQQAQHDLLLTQAELALALAVEVVLQRLTELALELAVGVERLGPELRGHRARGAGLARPHEADEYERAGLGGHRLHSMRPS
jgi:hypothetical protein